MTAPNKAAVLAKWPDAEAYIGLGGYCIIYPDKNEAHAEISQPFKEESEAWADAARRLK